MARVMLDDMIAELEGQLGVAPGADPTLETKAVPTAAPPAPTGAAPVPPAEGKKKKDKKKAKGDGGKNKGGGGGKGAVDENQPLITRLDIRVGQIVEVWEVEGSDKLFGEKIDVGEEEPRTICSGLRQFYTLEQMQGRRILVFCNLKPRKMGAVKSNGMVLCAEAEVNGARHVEFVDPPADAAVGERLTFEGLSGEPWVPNQIQKKKVLEGVFPGLRVNTGGEATWEGSRFMTTAGVCTAPTLTDCEMH
uniref:tRNA-binding domain-containing protein n=1 Tax=Phaeomonas parva TaxID=124430 RepID=A0A7S1XLC1_9STRA|mmetsp:Transcript_13533/g.40114  ORF Transcript_13533/g.40114 Transcript_13533/m.40114 type:complete len:249 (+) Transcript_13533:114-860(+)|eukprot:CAMPEP_0118874678 /NCGR_PEP_ID=MMETSP1163-20130328/16028_1 /TAXON_ID=124430 /ORGANISM="Phaeomonas parva, Strain CCMP2877" /LENGTH=248 /DNA_ID=CAMNT_0006810087 /DNA_START=128 /DNA_END=874 /DNA_ORIENTATION=+